MLLPQLKNPTSDPTSSSGPAETQSVPLLLQNHERFVAENGDIGPCDKMKSTSKNKDTLAPTTTRCRVVVTSAEDADPRVPPSEAQFSNSSATAGRIRPLEEPLLSQTPTTGGSNGGQTEDEAQDGPSFHSTLDFNDDSAPVIINSSAAVATDSIRPPATVEVSDTVSVSSSTSQPSAGKDVAVSTPEAKDAASSSTKATTITMLSDDLTGFQGMKKLASSPSTLITIKTSAKQRSGWGTPIGLGLKGGADTISNGTSGWGPPPSNSNNANSRSNDDVSGTSGWGSTPINPNPTATAAWGSIGSGSGANQSSDESNHRHTANNVNTNNVIGSKPQPMNHNPPMNQPTAPAPAPQKSTSWAAAAGKGLPTTDNSSNGGFNNTNNSSASKQLEQLNSVREALLSPNGWGGSNVNQDTSWDTDSRTNGQEAGAAAPAATAGAAGASGFGNGSKETAGGNSWNGGNTHKNDGTDLWKNTLYGEPSSAPKAQPANPWGNSPSDPTDYKHWGEDDESNGSAKANQSTSDNSFWRSDQPPANQFKKQDGWNSEPRGPAPNSSWNTEPMHPGNRENNMAPHNEQPPRENIGWGAGPSSSAAPQRSNSSSGWGSSAPPAPANRWGEHNSPTMPRRPMEDSPASHWGSGRPNLNGPTGGPAHTGGGWKDMPMPDGGPRMPPGPPRSGMIGQSSGPPKEPWGQPSHPRSGSGWGDEGLSNKGWGGDDVLKKDTGNWGKPWNEGPRNVGMPQPNLRTSPNGWGDDGGINNTIDIGQGGGWGGNKTDKSKEVIWSSKAFKLLSEMGYRKDDVENALRACNLRLDDALEMLNSSARRGMPNLDSPYNEPQFDPIRGNVGFPGGSGIDLISAQMGSMNPGSAAPGSGSSLPPINPVRGPSAGLGGMNTAPNVMPPQSRQAPSQQPSAQQLRLLVHQIQMAVQAGHLNPQILNQPLAPQTLLSLNQLLQQIKQLQHLQQQHSGESRRGGGAGSQNLMNLNINITKTKQHIQNLQNQISAQQANYLKSSTVNNQPLAPTVSQQQQQQQQQPESSTVQEMFNNGLHLMSGEGQNPNNGSRLLQWKKEFPKAPGSGPAKANNSQSSSSSNLLLDNGPWSRSSEANGGWPDSTKNNPDSDFGIPEFEPGKPWKGPGLKNADDDPNLTPGSVTAISINSISKQSPIVTNNVSAESSTLGLTSQSSTWSFGNNAPKNDLPKSSSNWLGGGGNSVPSSIGGSTLSSHIGQDLWGAKTSSIPTSGGRPLPPGLSGSSGWPQSSNNGWSSGNDNTGNGGSSNSGNGGSSNNNGSNNSGSPWLLLRNLTPQIDGSTLKTLCMQHGPLQHFDLYLNHNIALVMYASNREAAKAQKALNNCLLSNTTIHANMTSESDISTISQQLGVNLTQHNNSTGNNSSKSNDVWSDISVSTSSSAVGTSSSGSSLFPSGSVWSVPDHSSSLHLLGDLEI